MQTFTLEIVLKSNSNKSFVIFLYANLEVNYTKDAYLIPFCVFLSSAIIESFNNVIIPVEVSFYLCIKHRRVITQVSKWKYWFTHQMACHNDEWDWFLKENLEM